MRFMPDYEAALPVWGIDWDDPDLPRDLLIALTVWQDEFNVNYRPDAGWDSTERRERWAIEGNRLADELRRVLGPSCEVEVDLWPLDEVL